MRNRWRDIVTTQIEFAEEDQADDQEWISEGLQAFKTTIAPNWQMDAPKRDKLELVPKKYQIVRQSIRRTILQTVS